MEPLFFYAFTISKINGKGKGAVLSIVTACKNAASAASNRVLSEA